MEEAPRRGGGDVQDESPVDYLVYYRAVAGGPPEQCFLEAEDSEDATGLTRDVLGAHAVTRVKAIQRGTRLHAACHQLVPLQRFVGSPRSSS